MKNNMRYTHSAAFILFLGVVVGPAISSRLDLTSPLTAKGVQVSSRSVEVLTQLSDALSEVAGVATPSVVNISTTRVVKQAEQAPYDSSMTRSSAGSSATSSEQLQAILGISKRVVQNSDNLLTQARKLSEEGPKG